MAMNKSVIFGVTFALALLVLHTSAFAQAAAESALLNAASAASTVKAGSILGPALNQAGSQLAGRVQSQISPLAAGQTPRAATRRLPSGPVRGPVVLTGTGAGTASARGPMIASIQGGSLICSPANATASTPGTKVDSKTNCTNQNAATPPQQQYKSVITLSSPK
jgi:hypothetical protein